MATDWALLKDGTAKVAGQRLSDLHQIMTSTVSGFHRDATTQVESIHGHSAEGLGSELFKALHSVLMVCFPEELIIEKAMAEVVKGARDAAMASINQSEAQSAQGRLDAAKDELRRRLDDLAAAFDESYFAAWRAAIAAVPHALDAYFAEHPEHQTASFDANASEWEAWLCDQIGIRDAGVANPSAQALASLWAAFHHEFYRTTAHLNFFEMDNDTVRLLFLLRDVEPVSNVSEFLHAVGADVPYWERLVRLYHEAHGSDISEIGAFGIIEYAVLHPDA